MTQTPFLANAGYSDLRSASRREPGGFADRLGEISMFFRGNDPIHQTMRRIALRFEQATIPYAIVGGMAVNAHRHRRTTGDVDFLLSAEGLAMLRRFVTAGEFDPTQGRPRRFVDRATGVSFDILVAGLFPGSGMPGPIAYPDPETVTQTIDDLRVVNLPTLIQLKLAAHRYQDFADVVSLIRANRLDEGFADQLHPSVRGDYIECLEEMRREDDYEARQDQAFEDQPDQDAT
ncbi:MAG TPA: hypothetical protein VG326_00950 [Tepidisphaeraceae bacterium]|nr:hypothetical protein [Tepidisphaeraceae bacterium]